MISVQFRSLSPSALSQTCWRSAFLLVLVGFLSLATSCSTEDNAVGPPTVPTPAKSIVILYENDVHCAIDGYTRMAGLRDAIMKADTAYVGVVSSGDFLNGGVSGVLNQGQYIVDIMRSVGYDAVTLGNHEFDFGMPRLQQLMPLIQAPVVCANLYQAGAVPFFNVMCKIEMTGEMLLNMLSRWTANFPAKESIFPHVSGMKYTIHSVSHTISDVLVLNRQTNDYEPLDMQAKYTVACTDYYRNGGFYRTLVNADLLEQTSETQYETLAWFIREQLHKRVGDEYRHSQGRVTVIDD